MYGHEYNQCIKTFNGSILCWNIFKHLHLYCIHCDIILDRLFCTMKHKQKKKYKGNPIFDGRGCKNQLNRKYLSNYELDMLMIGCDLGIE